MNIDELKFEKLDRAGLDTLVKWADEEGWNPGPYDADVYWETDPEWYYGYYLDGELIAGGSIVSYNGEFGFMGFFIVKPELRSQGIGNQLWYQRRNKLLSRLNKDASIGMDGVVDMQPFYGKGGFEIAFRDERYKLFGKSFKIHDDIYEITDTDFPEIIEYDKKYFGFDRRVFITNWLEMPEVKAYKFVKDKKIQGMIIIRKANKGFKVCPLFAENPEIAEELLKAALNYVEDEPLYLDIPVINIEAKKLVEKYNGKYVFECARMYYGKQPDVNVNNIFGITTFELG